MAIETDLLRQILARLGASEVARTDTTLLLDIKQDLAVVQTNVTVLISDRSDAAKQRDKIYERIGQIETRLWALEGWRFGFYSIVGSITVLTAIAVFWEKIRSLLK